MTGFALSGVSGATAAASTTATKGSGSASASAVGLTQNQFLQLIIAQLQNQNPLSTGSGGNSSQSLVTEFADLSTVTGIDKLSSQVAAIQSGTSATQLSQAAGLIGKDIATTGDTFTVSAAGTATGAFTLASAAQNVTASVINPNGSLAATLSLGSQPAGLNQFNFSGGTAGQTYTYQINAASAGGAAVGATPYAVGQVSAVNLSGSASTLSVAGGTAPIPLSSVISILGATP
jgi:flagellar basal-body rod modification protein FlgD